MFYSPRLGVVPRQASRNRGRRHIAQDRTPPGERPTISSLPGSQSSLKIYFSKGKTEKAAHHFEIVLGIATTSGPPDDPFWIHHSLARTFFQQNRFDTAHDHIERAKPYAANSAFLLGCAAELRAKLWFQQRMFEKARLEASRAVDAYGKVGFTAAVGGCRVLLRVIDKRIDDSGELLQAVSRPVCINISSQGQETK